MAENPIPIDEEQDKENAPNPHPTTPVFERPTQPIGWWEVTPLGQEFRLFSIKFTGNFWIIYMSVTMYIF